MFCALTQRWRRSVLGRRAAGRGGARGGADGSAGGGGGGFLQDHHSAAAAAGAPDARHRHLNQPQDTQPQHACEYLFIYKKVLYTIIFPRK